MSWRIGVDIGGTFTDVALVDERSGRIGVVKVSTTPGDFAAGVIAALRAAIDRNGVAVDEVALLSHATTVVTNAILEEKGAKTALIATRGFRDVLELRRSARADLYDLNQDAPAVLVPRHRRLEVTERLDAAGAVVTPLDPAELDGIVVALKRAEVEAVAVTLLYSFLNDAHERAIGERLAAELPGVPVFLSSEVLPEIREFERTSTTAVCAYVGPVLESYLQRLAQATAEMGLPALHVMGSSGGVLEAAEALKVPAMAVESGPAAGVIAAQLIGRQLDRPNLISFDMGGTTAKASLIEDGRVETTAEYEVGGSGSGSRWLHGTGHPIRVPVIDLAEVSAGGGSIAWLDPAGALRVGPQSAGAEPGPVCYGKGGSRPTVTDANLVLGYLDPQYLLGGALAVDYDKAAAAITEQIAEPLGLGLAEAANGILDVVNNAMAEALRIVSVERGHDPREFALIAFGGAGPLHAARLAAELDIPQVVVPPIPGGFSALGLVAADLKRDYGRTYYAPLADVDPADLAGRFDALEQAARDMLATAGVAEDRRDIVRAADLRYHRQAYELTVALRGGPVDGAALDALAEEFHARHRQTYGHENRDEPIQMVNLRLTAVGRLAGLTLAEAPAAGGSLDDARKTVREAHFTGRGALSCGVYDRDRLPAGAELAGPAIVESMDSTLVVPPGWRARVDAQGFIMMEVSGDAE